MDPVIGLPLLIVESLSLGTHAVKLWKALLVKIKRMKEGGVSDEEIQAAIRETLAENPDMQLITKVQLKTKTTKNANPRLREILDGQVEHLPGKPDTKVTLVKASGKSPVGKTVAGKSLIAKKAPGKSPVGKTVAGKSPIAKKAPGKSPVAKKTPGKAPGRKKA